MLTLLAAHDPVDHVLPHQFFQIAPANLNFGAEQIPLLGFPLPTTFWFTNQLLMLMVAAGLCLLIFPRMARAYAAAPGQPALARGVGMNLLEALLQFIREQVARPVLKDHTDRFMPFLWTLFFFILFCNLLGLVPLADIIQLASFGKLKYIGGTATGNLAITGGLALCAFFTIHAAGVAQVYHQLVAGTYGHHGHAEHEPAEHGDGEHGGHGHGTGHGTGPEARGLSPGLAAAAALPLYVWNFAPHVFKPPAGTNPLAAAVLHVADFVMWLFLLALELIGAVIKPFALMIRLFANMIAGHIVLASILMLIFTAKTVLMGYTVAGISVLGCLAINCLELFVAFLQAYIFVFLTTLFINMAVAPEH